MNQREILAPPLPFAMGPRIERATQDAKLLRAVDQALVRPPPRVGEGTHDPRAERAALAAHAGISVGGADGATPLGAPPLPLGPQSQQIFDLERPLREARDAFEKSYFEFHLNQEGGSMTRVAEKTGLERTHLYRKLKQLGVDLTRNKRGGGAG